MYSDEFLKCGVKFPWPKNVSFDFAQTIQPLDCTYALQPHWGGRRCRCRIRKGHRAACRSWWAVRRHAAATPPLALARVRADGSDR